MTHDKSLWNALPNPALILQHDDLIDDLNPAGEAFFNMSAKSVRGAPVWDKIMVDAPFGDTLDRVRRDRAQLFINNADVSSGNTTPQRCNIQIGPFGDGEDVLILITPRQLANRLGRAHQAKTAARSAIGMAEMLAHEIKNPLAGIAGAAQLLAMNLPPDDKELTDLIVEETRRINGLLSQVEEFGNLRPPDRQPTNIHDILDRAKTSSALGFAAHMSFSEEYDPSLPPAHIDADQFQQVFLNLLRNAAEAADTRGGKIHLRTYFDATLRLRRTNVSQGSTVPLQVEIIDDGTGLPPAIASEIFEPFVSGRENGTGLGLALVSKIVTDNDAWIEVDSVPGRTVFRLSLPIFTGKEPD
jgi:two-component system nitrogen regulation sensor histidine kinase GlnL